MMLLFIIYLFIILFNIIIIYYYYIERAVGLREFDSAREFVSVHAQNK